MTLQQPAADATSPPRPDATVPPRRLQVHRLALLCSALMLATVLLSAYLRLSQAGLGCADWPACYGQALSDAAHAPPGAPAAGVALARLAHRIVASLVLVLVVALLVICRTARPTLAHEARLAAALLVLALALAALGIVTPGAQLPAVTLGNLIGGFVMLALCWRLVGITGPIESPTFQFRRWAIPALALLLVQVALGALLSGSFAALSCSDWSDCSRTARAAGWDWQVFNPWQRPRLAAAPPFNAGGAWVQLAHRGLALLLLPLLALVGLAALRQGRRPTALLLLLLPGLQVGIAWAMLAAGLPIGAVLLHNLSAALLLAALARLV
jgi:cytochrome c oxidase assembly protein subunit 15